MQELNIFEDAFIVGSVNGLDVTADGHGQDARKRGDVLLFAVDRRDVHEGGDSLLRGRRAADDVQTARQQAGFNLHKLLVNLTDDLVSRVGVKVGGVRLRIGRNFLDILVQVARNGGGDDGVDDGRTTTGIL